MAVNYASIPLMDEQRRDHLYQDGLAAAVIQREECTVSIEE